MDDDSDSSLSSTHSIDDEVLAAKMNKPMGIQRFFKPTPKNEEKEPTPEPPKRAPSPPHQYVLADNDSIAFIVMFRSRFSDAFPKSLPHYGPQDIERGLTGDVPQEDVERLLCALLSLVLNRKKDVEKGHYGRALEDAIQQNQSQWPNAWNGQNPLHGGGSFNSMTPEQRLTLLKALVLWALNSSEAVQSLIKAAYKQTRRDDDKNQPKSVQPWFSDSYRRKYYLVEGLEDTHFRVYRENDGKTAKTNTWFSIAGSIDEVTILAEKLEAEGTTLGKVNGGRIRSAIPRFEAGDEKRKRRDYRLARKAAFTRPEPGFSLYEGRTRGKRMRYTYSDGEEDSDSASGRRSTRNSGYATPSESGPTITSSGRQVKSRIGGMYGESLPMDQRRELDREHETRNSAEEDELIVAVTAGGRQPRASGRGRGRYAEGLESESETDAGAVSSGKDWSGSEDDSDDDEPEPDFEDGDDEDDEMNELANGHEDEEEEEDNTHESLVVQLRYRPGPIQAKLSEATGLKGTPLREVMNASNDDTIIVRGSRHESVPYLNGKAEIPSKVTLQANGIAAINGSVSGPVSTDSKVVNGMDDSQNKHFGKSIAMHSGLKSNGVLSTADAFKQEKAPQPVQAMDLS